MTRGKSWSPAEDEVLMTQRAAGVLYKTIADMIGRPLNGCEQRYCFLRRLGREVVVAAEVAIAAVPTVKPPTKPSAFKVPDKRRCLNSECRKWFAPSHKGKYFCIGHRPADDTGMVERTANYRSPARASF